MTEASAGDLYLYHRWCQQWRGVLFDFEATNQAGLWLPEQELCGCGKRPDKGYTIPY